jgi:hypothetical protein
MQVGRIFVVEYCSCLFAVYIPLVQKAFDFDAFWADLRLKLARLLGYAADSTAAPEATRVYTKQ